MGKRNLSEDFKSNAVHQITLPRYALRKVSERSGVSTCSPYKWMNAYPRAASPASSVDHEGVNCRFKPELVRMTKGARHPKGGQPRTSPSTASSSLSAGCVAA